jgi:hypothetical protein
MYIISRKNSCLKIIHAFLIEPFKNMIGLNRLDTSTWYDFQDLLVFKDTANGCSCSGQNNTMEMHNNYHHP